MHKVIPESLPSFKDDMKRKIYPTFSIDDEDLPDIKDWEVGEKYVIVMEVEQLSKRQGQEWQGDNNKDKRVHATFKITKIGVDEPEEETYADEYARRRSGAKK